MLMSTGRLKIGAAIVLLSPFVPMLFMGEEWGAATPFQYFTDHRDPELGRAVSEGRRSEFAAFGWAADEVPDPQDIATFERSRLCWDELARSPHAELLQWYRALIRIRRSTAVRRDPGGGRCRVRTRVDEQARWLTIRQGSVTIAVNLAETPATVAVPAGRLLLASEPGVRLRGAAVELPPDSVAVVEG
jgi:maltooligosyltrehalose trehalohydrolase